MFSPKIDPEFEALIRPLSAEERSRLEALLIATGAALDPLKVWRDPDTGTVLLIDGHNRYDICLKHDLPFTYKFVSLPDREAVKQWMRESQRARRNLTPDQQIIEDLLSGKDPALSLGPRKISQARALVANAPDFAKRVASGEFGIFVAYNKWRLSLGEMPKPRAPRGPSGQHAATPPANIPEGHELRAQSTLINSSGELSGRWDKSGIAPEEPRFDPVPEGHHVVKTSTYVRADGQVGGQYVTAEHDKAARESAKWEAWKRHADMYKGLADPAPAPQHTDEDLIALYPLGDPHIGMLAWGPETGENFDLKIALRELLTCVRLMVASAPPARQAIVCNLGDFLHAQGDDQRTPGHGHKLDVDGRYAKVLDAGHVLLRGIVDAALERHEHVTIRNLPGNHDPQVAAELAMWLKAIYERETRVTVADAHAPYQFDRFGRCLFGWAHGDGAKAEQLPLLMANAQAEAWGETTEHVWHTGHVHHLSRKEFTGCVVETHRTMAGKDYWHASKGYSAKRSLQMIAYHRVYGEVTRNTVGLERVRVAIHGRAA